MNKSRTVYGASVGILMLETQFPRFPGDLGHAASWPFPVLYQVVRGATASHAIGQDAQQLLTPFVSAAKELLSMGADGITTSCGFLALLQGELSKAIDAPVASSSLMQIPWMQTLLPPGKRVGVLTIDSQSLTEEHLKAVGADYDTPIAGTENGKEFTAAILEDRPQINFERCRQDNLQAAQELQQQNPDLGAIVLECTNMAPFAADIRQATGLPVLSINSLIRWFQSGLCPPHF